MSEAKTFLVKTDEFEAVQMVVCKGYEACHDHHVPGPITVQCIQGCIALTADGEMHVLKTGQWTFLPGGVSHTIKGVDDSLVLLTVMYC